MTEVGLWHVRQGEQPVRLTQRALPSEKDLESWIESDPSLIAPGLHAVRRQVPLGRKFMDLLAVESPGVWVVCELKKVALEREVFAQALDYVARIDELSRDELAELAGVNHAGQSQQTRDLIMQALEREDNGEGREVRIVLAGVGVTNELSRMVTYLSSKFEVPIRVCTLSAVTSPSGDGLILIRDVSDDTESAATGENNSSTFEERFASVRNHFAAHNMTPLLQASESVFAANPNLYLRPWKKALMVAPSANHSRCLVYLTPRKNGVYVTTVAEAIEEFFLGADMNEIEVLPVNEIITSIPNMITWAQTISDAIGVDEHSSVFSERPAWNGKDWYVVFGDDETRSWDDAMKYGFVSAGGGDWYSRTLRNVPLGAHIFAYIPQSGYVGAGEVTGPPQLFEDSFLASEKDLKATYVHSNGETEYILPVRWSKAVPTTEGLKGLGLFANQNSACKLRDSKTLAKCYEFFDIDESLHQSGD